MKQIKYILINLSLFILIGCGSNTVTTATTTAKEDIGINTEITTTTESDIGIGHYIDSAIEGVFYHCGTQKGTTDKDGRFKYQMKQKCRFSINDITLREVKPEELFDGVQIFEDNVTVAQFLQSLDNDANATNGIKITIKTIEVLKSHTIVKLPKHEDDLKDIIKKIRVDNSDYNGSFITIIEVNIHLEKTRTKIKKDKDNNQEKQDIKDSDDSNITHTTSIDSTVTDEEVVSEVVNGEDEEKQDVKNNDDDKVYTLSTITDVEVSSKVKAVSDELNKIKTELDGVQAYDGNKLKQEYDKVKGRFNDVLKLLDDVWQTIDKSNLDKLVLKKEINEFKDSVKNLKDLIDGYRKDDDNSVEAIDDIKSLIDGVILQTNLQISITSKPLIAEGYYIDSPIEGIDYKCGTQSGTTDSEGMFLFDVGQNCLFSFLNISLRLVEANELSDGVTIIEDNLDIARYLQSLDNDGDANNGITITSAVVKTLEDNLLYTMPFSDDDVKKIVDILQSSGIGYEGRFVSKEEASEHLANTIYTAQESSNIDYSSLVFDSIESINPVENTDTENNFLSLLKDDIDFIDRENRKVARALNILMGNYKINDIDFSSNEKIINLYSNSEKDGLTREEYEYRLKILSLLDMEGNVYSELSEIGHSIIEETELVQKQFDQDLAILLYEIEAFEGVVTELLKDKNNKDKLIDAAKSFAITTASHTAQAGVSELAKSDNNKALIANALAVGLIECSKANNDGKACLAKGSSAALKLYIEAKFAQDYPNASKIAQDLTDVLGDDIEIFLKCRITDKRNTVLGCGGALLNTATKYIYKATGSILGLIDLEDKMKELNNMTLAFELFRANTYFNASEFNSQDVLSFFDTNSKLLETLESEPAGTFLKNKIENRNNIIKAAANSNKINSMYENIWGNKSYDQDKVIEYYGNYREILKNNVNDIDNKFSYLLSNPNQYYNQYYDNLIDIKISSIYLNSLNDSSTSPRLIVCLEGNTNKYLLIEQATLAIFDKNKNIVTTLNNFLPLKFNIDNKSCSRYNIDRNNMKFLEDTISIGGKIDYKIDNSDNKIHSDTIDSQYKLNVDIGLVPSASIAYDYDLIEKQFDLSAVVKNSSLYGSPNNYVYDWLINGDSVNIVDNTSNVIYKPTVNAKSEVYAEVSITTSNGNIIIASDSILLPNADVLSKIEDDNTNLSHPFQCTTNINPLYGNSSSLVTCKIDNTELDCTLINLEKNMFECKDIINEYTSSIGDETYSCLVAGDKTLNCEIKKEPIITGFIPETIKATDNPQILKIKGFNFGTDSVVKWKWGTQSGIIQVASVNDDGTELITKEFKTEVGGHGTWEFVVISNNLESDGKEIEAEKITSDIIVSGNRYIIDDSQLQSNLWSKPLNRDLVTSKNYDYLSQIYYDNNNIWHGAYDFVAQDSTITGVHDSVHAIDDGIVVARRQDNDNLTDNMSIIYIKHKTSNGKEFLGIYGHAYSELAVGSIVKQNDIIASVRPNSKPEHLHFGITTNINDFPTANQTWGGIHTGIVNPIDFLNEHKNIYLNNIETDKESYSIGNTIEIDYKMMGASIGDELTVTLKRTSTKYTGENISYITLNKTYYSVDKMFITIPDTMMDGDDYHVFIKHNKSGTWAMNDKNIKIINSVTSYAYDDSSTSMVASSNTDDSIKFVTIYSDPSKGKVIEQLTTNKGIYQKGDEIVISYNPINLGSSNMMSVSLKRDSYTNTNIESPEYVRLSINSSNSGRLVFTIPDHTALGDDFRIYVKDNESGVYSVSDTISIVEKSILPSSLNIEASITGVKDLFRGQYMELKPTIAKNDISKNMVMIMTRKVDGQVYNLMNQTNVTNPTTAWSNGIYVTAKDDLVAGDYTIRLTITDANNPDSVKIVEEMFRIHSDTTKPSANIGAIEFYNYGMRFPKMEAFDNASINDVTLILKNLSKNTQQEIRKWSDHRSDTWSYSGTSVSGNNLVIGDSYRAVLLVTDYYGNERENTMDFVVPNSIREPIAQIHDLKETIEKGSRDTTSITVEGADTDLATMEFKVVKSGGTTPIHTESWTNITGTNPKYGVHIPILNASEGEYICTLTVTDKMGYSTTDKQSFTITPDTTIDTIKPTTSVSGINAEYIRDDIVSITMRANDNIQLSTVTLQVAPSNNINNRVVNMSWYPTGSSFAKGYELDTSNLLTGEYQYSLFAKDSSGNEALVSHGSFRVNSSSSNDTEKPTGSVSGVFDNYLKGNIMYLKLNAYDNEEVAKMTLHIAKTSDINTKLVDESWNVSSWSNTQNYSVDTSSFVAGEYQYTLFIVDKSDNLQSYHGTFNINSTNVASLTTTIDRVSPSKMTKGQKNITLKIYGQNMDQVTKVFIAGVANIEYHDITNFYKTKDYVSVNISEVFGSGNGVPVGDRIVTLLTNNGKVEQNNIYIYVEE